MKMIKDFFEYLGESLVIEKYSLEEKKVNKVAAELSDLILHAKKDMLLFVNNPLPSVLVSDSYRVVDSIVKVSNRIPIYFNIKKDRDDEGVKVLAQKLRDLYYQGVNKSFTLIEKDKIGNKRLREDCFYIVDGKHIVWEKPTSGEIEVLRNANILCSDLQKNINFLLKDTDKYSVSTYPIFS